MIVHRLAVAAVTLALAAGLAGVPAEQSRAAAVPEVPAATALMAVHFQNCSKLNKKYPHGVGKRGAKDKVRGKSKPVTNFTRNNAVYAANRGLDRDHDGVACEKH
jgi:hypothetical protein